ncbi:5-3 exonuclease, partial [Mycobacterium tuberculosis SUMu001]
MATRRTRLRRACDRHWTQQVATRCTRLRRACDRHWTQQVATRCTRLRRACDRQLDPNKWRPAAPGSAALAIATGATGRRQH